MQKIIKSRTLQMIMFQTFGTFLLSYGIGCSAIEIGQDFVFATSLFVALAIGGEITGGQFNPIMTVATFIDKRHKKVKIYMLSQFIGALLGGFWSLLLQGDIQPLYTQKFLSFDQCKYLINQLIGSIFFSICVLTLTNKYTSHAAKSWQMYLSIPTAFYLTRKMAGCTVLNPAVGFAYQTISAIIKNDWTIFINSLNLIIPALIGGWIGGIFMKKIYEPLLLSAKYEEMNKNNQE